MLFIDEKDMRESCISHVTRKHLAVVRWDYYQITGDAVSAAILNEFEHRANAALTQNPEQDELIYVGKLSCPQIAECLMGICSEKHVRKRLEYLAHEQAIIKSPNRRGQTPEWWLNLPKVQQAIDSINHGQTTTVKRPRSNDRTNHGQTTELPRSNDRISLYKSYLDLLKRSESVRDRAGKASKKTHTPVQEKVFLDQESAGVGNSPSEMSFPEHSEPAARLAKANAAGRDELFGAAAIDFDAWHEAYSQFKPDKWRPLLLFAPGDTAAVRGAVQQVGDDARARELFVLALCWVRLGGEAVAWWRDRDLNFSSLLNAPRMHFLGLGASGEDAGINPQAIAASGFDDSMLAMAQTAVSDPNFVWEK